jgi:hypothetical protein
MPEPRPPSDGGRCPKPRTVLSGQGRLVQVRCKSRRCPSCGHLWAGDTRQKLLVNVEAYGGDVALVTITAPGRDVLPYGEGGTQVDRAAARRWNREAREQFRGLHRRASERTKRWARGQGIEWAGVVARAWAFQRRGVLHVHLIVPMGTAGERLASHRYVAILDALRDEHGFGFVDRGRRTKSHQWARQLERVPQERAARYLAKYVAGHKLGAGGRLELAETVSHPDVPPHVVHVHRHLTARTGCTMRSLRLRRSAWWTALRTCSGDVDAARILSRLQTTGEVLPGDLARLACALPAGP